MNFFETLAQTFANKPVDWDELEAALIRADLGVDMTMRIIDRAKDREAWSVLGIGNVIEVAREEILKVLPKRAEPLRLAQQRPTVVLVVGVNGTGKTTSTAKLAHYLSGRGGSPEPPAGDWGQSPLPAQDRHRVMLAAADTFRAAAIEQLGIWAERLGVPMVRGEYNADPAALCFDAYQAAAKQKIDFLLCDTAGRLHTKTNLMAELQKVKRILAKIDPPSQGYGATSPPSPNASPARSSGVAGPPSPGSGVAGNSAPHEILLVIDATTGGNALNQAREFHQALGLTGLIVTKLDGSGKGGIVVAIQNELKIPTRFVGTGEKIDNFALFDAREFVEKLL